MIDPDYYLFADLSITEIEGPAEFYDWEAEEGAWFNPIHYWRDIMALHRQDEMDSAEADDFGDVLVELELPQELLDW